MATAGLWFMALAAVGAADPAVLLDPAGAAAAAEALPPLRRAETLLLAGEPEAARAALGELSRDEPRVLRLIADTWVREGDPVRAEPALAALEAHPRWAAHARQQRAYLELGRQDRLFARGALLAFVVCLAVLALSGARELLRFHPESAMFAVAAVAAALLVRSASPQAAPLVELAGGATFFLIHGAAAASRRTRPGPRGRLLLATLVLIGAVGAMGTLGLQVGPGGLIRLVAASARPTDQTEVVDPRSGPA
ncbi:MAG: hypothetical protein KC933_15140 [Myxococcales bacterium]|nr:hypothetical protein [Myxococcales bacterium]MCB9645083.1 hypothetical protein [Deltaproteobacteria bacterium]